MEKLPLVPKYFITILVILLTLSLMFSKGKNMLGNTMMVVGILFTLYDLALLKQEGYINFHPFKDKHDDEHHDDEHHDDEHRM